MTWPPTPPTYRGYYVGTAARALIGGNHHDKNWRKIADSEAQLRADLNFVRGVDGITWDDLSVSLTRDKQGQSSKPDYDFTENGLLFPQNDPAEIVYLVIQMKHAKVLGTGLMPHVHYIQDEVPQPTWKIDYRWYNNGAAVPGSWTTISTADGNKGVFDYTSGAIMQIGAFVEVLPPASEDVSSNFDLRLYRDDNDVTGDVLAKFIDLHYQIDSLGSDAEYVKQS